MNTAFNPNKGLPFGGANTYYVPKISDSLQQTLISECLCEEDHLLTFLLLSKGPKSFQELKKSWHRAPSELLEQLLRMLELGIIFMEKQGGVNQYLIHRDQLQLWVRVMILKITGEEIAPAPRWYHLESIPEYQIGLN